MLKAQEELLGQHISLRQTFVYMQGKAEELKDFYGISGFYSVTFTGCGWMTTLCESAELSLRMRGGMTTNHLSAGDLTLNSGRYLDMLHGTLILAASRTGRDTELVYALETARQDAGAAVITCALSPSSKLAGTADLHLDLPWVYEQSVFPTRSLTNAYLINLFNIGLLAGDQTLIDDIKLVTDDFERFINAYRPALERLAEAPIARVIVLADGELYGPAETGAALIQHMSGVPAWGVHMLDSRDTFGSMIAKDTLVVAAIPPEDDVYLNMFMRELKDKGAKVVTLSQRENNDFGAALNIVLPAVKHHACRGFGLLYTLQALALFLGIIKAQE